MNTLKEILANNDVEIAAVDDKDRSKNTKLDKAEFTKKLEFRENMEKIG